MNLKVGNAHVGDVVRLVGGGPWMTVVEVGNRGSTVRTNWFEPDLENSGAFSGLKDGFFPVESLQVKES